MRLLGGCGCIGFLQICYVAKVALIISAMLCFFFRNDGDVKQNQHIVRAWVASPSQLSSVVLYRGKCFTLQ